MTTKAAIDRFVEGRTLAIVGVSAKGKGFGNAACTELKARGYRVLPVHPTATTIQGQACSRSLAELPERVENLLVVVAPDAAERVVREAAGAGIRRVWLQQGAESAAVIKACEEQGLEAVHGHCILMFAGKPGGFHKFHRWLWGVLGKVPA
jgi:predicted CoA-binding protein